MRNRISRSRLLIPLFLLPLLGCGGGSEPAKPVVIRGHVFSDSGTPIPGARVAALDVNGAPVSETVTTDSQGAYELDVTSSRNQSITLRASASGFEAFPSGIRRSLPIDLTGAVERGSLLVYSGSLTEITLVALADPAGLGSISGKVVGTGALVVVEGPAVASTVSNVRGEYVVFNLPAGSYSVRAYVAGWQFNPVQAEVMADQETPGVDLASSGPALGSVSGNVSIVNAPGGSATSVVLVVASTFNEVTLRGDVPPGLRAPRTGPPNVTGTFTITDVPDGTYKVLAAFENDGLVRDPDPNIAGTQVVEVTVSGNNASIPESFKITEALAVLSPGANEPSEVVGTPTLIWADDSSEDFYSVEVFDSSGNVIWEDPDVPGVSGSSTVSVLYGGPGLQPGRTYQFRATSWRAAGNADAGPISSTEELRGIMVAR